VRESARPDGEVHKLCTIVNFASLPALGGLLWWRFRRVTHARILGVLSVMSGACAIPFAAAFLTHAHVAGLGLFERGVVVLDIAMFATLAAWRGPRPQMYLDTASRSGARSAPAIFASGRNGSRASRSTPAAQIVRSAGAAA
jgi:hypothetical protein